MRDGLASTRSHSPHTYLVGQQEDQQVARLAAQLAYSLFRLLMGLGDRVGVRASGVVCEGCGRRERNEPQQAHQLTTPTTEQQTHTQAHFQ